MQNILDDKRLEEAKKRNRAELLEEEALASSSQLSSIPPVRPKRQDDREGIEVSEVPDLADPDGEPCTTLVAPMP